jgi:squalene-associated FAD-dependent desaturase
VTGEGRVVVLGGGLAGITAALDCAQAGANVTLVEVRRRLGGAAYSFERDGLVMDNGQHVFMRCCHAYRRLLTRLGSERAVYVQPRLRVPVLSPARAPAALGRGRLPAPLHMAPSLARYRHLRPVQRLRVAGAVMALTRLDPSDRSLDEVSFGDWLARRGQDGDTVARFWEVIVRPTLNAQVADASLALGAFVFQTALLGATDAGDIGFHRSPLGETIGSPAERALARAGVRVVLGSRAESVERDGGGFRVRANGDSLPADAVVVAVPHARAAGLLEPLLPQLARALGEIPSSPIVNLHVLFDRRVCDEQFAAGVDTPVQYVVDRSGVQGVPDGHQYLAVSLSGAQREMTMSVDELRAGYLPALARLLPRVREANVERFFVTREHAATFMAAPGLARLRPQARTEVAGLLLAGAWTDTGWPATLEGAVLSGHAAAAAALTQLRLGTAQQARAATAFAGAAGERA